MTELVNKDNCSVGPPIIPVERKLPVDVMSSLVKAGEWEGLTRCGLPRQQWSQALPDADASRLAVASV